MAYSVDIIAEHFLAIESMTPKKLQKLCYYAQAWYFTYFDEKLIDTDFEAWVHGPASHALYQKFKPYTWNEIDKCASPRQEIDDKAKRIISETYRIYGSLSGDELEALTHSESPWIITRNGKSPCESSTDIIDVKLMKEFCQQVLANSQPNV